MDKLSATHGGQSVGSRNNKLNANYSTPANIDELLSRLEKVKNTGADKYLACCPAHDDRSPSLAIKQVDDKILLHCFSGCSVAEIVAAIGLELQDLFPKTPDHHRDQRVRIPKFSASELFPLLMQECLIIALCMNDLLKTGVLSEDDRLRVNKSITAIFELDREIHR